MARNNKVRNSVINWFKDVWSLIKDHKKIVFIILGFIAIVVAAIVISTTVAKKKAQAELEAAQEATTDKYVITDEPLAQDAYAEVNALLKTYYDAVAAGDFATIEGIKTSVEDKERIIITKKAEFIEAYPVVTCYTKPGPEEGTYLVFAYYEVKLKDFEEQVPGLNVWYVCTREDGSVYINEDEQSADLENYCKLIAVQDDVVDLNNTINVKFNEIVAQDEALAEFLDQLPDVLTAAVGEELAKEDAGVVEEQQAEEQVEDTAQDQGPVKAKTTDVVNIRSSDSENADKVGKAQKGDVFTVLEQKANGWSKIEYEGKECFIKSEYLEVISQEAVAQADAVTDEQAAAASPDSGTATAKDTINIRETASTNAPKLAICYKGETLTVISKQNDGWTKVKYNGKTGFVKSEYLE